jgi:hypothetical protein
MMRKIYLIFPLVLLISACVPQAIPTEIPTAQPTFTPTPTQQITPIPTSELTKTTVGIDRINIFLVAIGDNGDSGKMIGCGDSLVPVEIQIEPTLGVLRAAIDELLKLEGERLYGQSGLYNALYLSDLKLDDVAIKSSQAHIALSGELVYGGECDIPRIEQQLTALALQFSTVDSVAVTVNGESLEKLLDLRG